MWPPLLLLLAAAAALAATLPPAGAWQPAIGYQIHSQNDLRQWPQTLAKGARWFKIGAKRAGRHWSLSPPTHAPHTPHTPHTHHTHRTHRIPHTPHTHRTHCAPTALARPSSLPLGADLNYAPPAVCCVQASIDPAACHRGCLLLSHDGALAGRRTAAVPPLS